MSRMIKYFVIISSIFVTFVTGQQQGDKNVANYQSVPTYLPSAVELQLPLETRANKITPNVVGEEVQKIPCPLFTQRRLENPNIPGEQPWATTNKWNSVPPALRRSHTEDAASNVENPMSRRSNSKDSESWRFIADDPISLRSNTEASKSRRSQEEEPSSPRLISDDPTSRNSHAGERSLRRLMADDPISRRNNIEDPKSRRSPADESSSRILIADVPISQRSNAEDPKSRRSHAEESSSRRLIADDPTSRRNNIEDSKSRRSPADESSSRILIADDPISQRFNAEDPKSQRSHAEEPSSRRLIADDPTSRRSNAEDGKSRRSHSEEPSSRRSIADDPISRTFNPEGHISRSPNVVNPMSRRANSEDYVSRKSNEEIPESLIIADDPISRRYNADGLALRNIYGGVPTPRRYNEQFPASRRYPWQPIDRLGQTLDDAESQKLVLPLPNDRRMPPYTNVMQTQQRRDNFDGPPSTVQPLYNNWQMLPTTNPLQVPSHLDAQTLNNMLNVPTPKDDAQVQPVLNYPVEMTSATPNNPVNPSDCNLKRKLTNVDEPHSETRREEGTPRRIMPGILKQKNQVSTPKSVNLRENNQPDLTTMSNELNANSENIATTHVENIQRTNELQGTSNEENEDRMSIADIEQQLMEPAKGAGIIKITDAHLSVIDSSRVCYACSSITDPTCWSPERKTTVKYCARGRDSCVTKTYKGKDSLVVIRDCSSACDDALPVLGKKYESCSICGDDLCNSLHVDANGASSIYTRNTIAIVVFSSFIKYYFP